MSPSETQQSTRQGFPWLYVLRWILGLATTAHGLYTLYWLLSSWAYLTDQAIILPWMSPMRLLPSVLLKTATGFAILLRSRFAIPLSVAWVVAFIVMTVDPTNPATLSGLFWMGCAELAAIILFLVLLWSRRLLR